MTEATIIALIIVGGAVALLLGVAWLILRAAFDAWLFERMLASDEPANEINVHVDNPHPISADEFRRKFDFN